MAKNSGRYLRILILLCIFCVGTAVAQTSYVYWAPWVTNTTTDSATINWRGETNGNGSIEYATSSYFNQHHSFEYTKSSNVTAQYQHVSLTGLEPNTSYTYWVKPSGDASAFGNRTFRTVPVRGPFTFIVIGDTREGHNYSQTKRFKYVADAIANESDVLFVLHDGDFARFDFESRWAIFFQSADRMFANSAIFPVIGNHEYHNNSCTPPTAAVNYHSAFDMPLNYSFDVAGIRFVVLNSPDPNNATCDDPQTSLNLSEHQAPWLKEQLDNNMLGTFTIHHHPIWEYGKNTSDPNLAPWETLYHTYNISANFAGHVHNYQRYNVSGIPYFIVGNSGAPAEKISLTEPRPNGFQLILSMQLGYLKVTVDPANNTATAWEIAVGKVTGSDDNETPILYNPPIIGDKITFPLEVNEICTPATGCNASKMINK